RDLCCGVLNGTASGFHRRADAVGFLANGGRRRDEQSDEDHEGASHGGISEGGGAHQKPRVRIRLWHFRPFSRCMGHNNGYQVSRTRATPVRSACRFWRGIDLFLRFLVKPPTPRRLKPSVSLVSTSREARLA